MSTRLTIITGLSGSGKSVALATLEDEGFFCIDNVPVELLPDMLDRLLASGLELYSRLAIGIDMRSSRDTASGLETLLKGLRERGDLHFEIIFLDTDRSVLVRRFSETRRRHPLSTQHVPLISAIDDEARLLDGVKDLADLVVDTTALTVHDLRDVVRTYLLGTATGLLSLVFQSFGFKYGTPASTDFMFDVRALPNPHWEPELRPYTGMDTEIIGFLEDRPDVVAMRDDIREFLDRWLPLFDAENRSYLTVSIGCTGGRHRSVYMVEQLAAWFAARRANVSLRHRELS